MPHLPQAHAIVWAIYTERMAALGIETPASAARPGARADAHAKDGSPTLSAGGKGSSGNVSFDWDPSGGGACGALAVARSAPGASAIGAKDRSSWTQSASRDMAPAPTTVPDAGATLAEYVVDWMYIRFGMRSMAAQQLAALCATLRQHIETDTRLRLFAQVRDVTVT